MKGTLPYGDAAFNFSINLGNLFLPIAVLLSVVTKDITLKQIFFEFLTGCLGSGLLGICFAISELVYESFSIKWNIKFSVWIAIESPCPWLVGRTLGSVFSVSVWIIVECVFIR